MEDYLFRIEVDNTLREILSTNFNLLSFERGPDFKTKDGKYFIEMKSRRINNDGEKNHFSIKPKQYHRFIKLTDQTILQPSSETQIYFPNLMFLLLKYKTKIPISQIDCFSTLSRPEKIKENLDLSPGSYIVNYENLKKYDNSKKWMSIKTRDLDQVIEEENIKSVITKRLSIPIFPIGENSEELAKRWA